MITEHLQLNSRVDDGEPVTTKNDGKPLVEREREKIS